MDSFESAGQDREYLKGLREKAAVELLCDIRDELARAHGAVGGGADDEPLDSRIRRVAASVLAEGLLKTIAGVAAARAAEADDKPGG